MTTSTRSDVHNAVNLVTEDYDYLGSLDWRAGQSGDVGSVKARVDLINAVIVTPGRKWARIHGSGQCDHCGAHLRYAALMLHRPSNTVVEIGETCLENRFDRATADFQRLRKLAELDREAHRVKLSVAGFVSVNPDLEFLATGELPPASANNSFIADVGAKLRRYGSLSDAQVNAVRAAVIRDRNHAIEKANKVTEPKVDVVVGKIQISGEILSTKYVDSQFGSTLKMLVRDNRGFKVWGSVPRSIDGQGDLRGRNVQFTATVEASKDDSTFGFFSRPTQARIVA
jgi:hypothetical protein